LNQHVPEDVRVRVVVADNSARASPSVVSQTLKTDSLPVTYVHEPRPGIPFARNACLATAHDLGADWIAFIDDDEVAPPGWLSRMLEIAALTKADVVHGHAPTVDGPELEAIAAAWRPPATVTAKSARKAATNNVILRSWLVSPPFSLTFDTAMLTGGSDGEFFMRVVACGARIVRTRDAPVFEERHAAREEPAWRRRRAFRVGANCNYRYHKNRRPYVLAAALVAARALARIGAGAGMLGLAVCVLPIRRSRANAFAQRGVLDLCFAWGCVAPYIGVNPAQYY
jgi:glycosyltransferase involved in cell wall biosynthesis